MTGASIVAALQSALSEADAQWLADATGAAATGTIEDLLQRYTEASRRLGLTPLDAAHTDAAAPLARWTREDAGRLALVLARHEHAASPDAFIEAATACYEQGDAREQQSWLRGLGYAPAPERFLSHAIDACRTNILPLFEAIACENPYPARYFPERNFNQMVLKALFNNVALARIVGLSTRANAELSRMATDYAAERRAASRPVPADIGMAIG